MNPHIEILLAIPCTQHHPGPVQSWCPQCGAPPAVVGELERLRDELDQQRIRAEAAEQELEIYRANEAFGTTCIDCGGEIGGGPTVATVDGDLMHVGCGDPDEEVAS